MKYLIKNDLASLGGSSSITDEQSNPCFSVKGKFFSITRKKFVRDGADNLLFTVRNKYWHAPFRRSALIYSSEGELIVKLTDKLFGGGFKTTNYLHNIEITFDHGFRVTLDGKEVGLIKRSLNLVRDTFELDCFDEAYAALLCAITIAIDNIIDSRLKQRN